MTKLMSTTMTSSVEVKDPKEAEALAAMLKKYGIKVLVVN